MASGNKGKVVLLRPSCVPPEENIIPTYSQPPAGLLYVAAPLVAAGYEVAIVDQGAVADWRGPLREALSGDVVMTGITCLTGLMIANGIEMARFVREHARGCPIVWGGAHPTMEPGTALASPWADMIAVGEGEETALELCDALRAGRPLGDVKGLVFKNNGQPVRTALREPYDLNRLPPLPLGLVDYDVYEKAYAVCAAFNFTTSRVMAIETSRGCTHRCTYCVMSSRENTRRMNWRGMDAGKALDMVEQVGRECGIGAFTFVDDNFFVDMDRVKALVAGIEQRNLEIEWFADIRMDTILAKTDEAFLKRMEAAGLRSLGIGIESGSDRMLKFIRKGETRATYLAANRRLSVTSIMPRYGFIQGLPGEERADAEQTYTLIAEMLRDNANGQHALNKLLPTPNTPLFEECVARGLARPGRLEDWATYCDTAWRRGPGPWMDPGTVDLIMCLLYYQVALTLANPGLGLGRHNWRRLVLRAATALVTWRVRHRFYRLRFEEALMKLVMLQGPLRMLKRFDRAVTGLALRGAMRRRRNGA